MNNTRWVANSESTLNATQRYFENGKSPGCKAGLRFLVVTSDGSLQPCSMQFRRYSLHEQSRMINEFTRHNTCDECYVSIRSYLDKSFPEVFRENVGASSPSSHEPTPAESGIRAALIRRSIGWKQPQHPSCQHDLEKPDQKGAFGSVRESAVQEWADQLVDVGVTFFRREFGTPSRDTAHSSPERYQATS